MCGLSSRQTIGCGCMMCPKVEKPELLNGAVYVMNEFHLISGIITHDYLIIDS